MSPLGWALLVLGFALISVAIAGFVIYIAAPLIEMMEQIVENIRGKESTVNHLKEAVITVLAIGGVVLFFVMVVLAVSV